MRPLPVLVVRPLAALLVVLVATVAACSSGAAVPSGLVGVSGAWARSAPADGTSAAYVEIQNGTSSPVVLTGAMSDAAEMVTLHETSTDSGGMTGMHHVPAVTIAAGDTLRLEPGGYHLMLEQLTQPLDAGSLIALVLTFQGGVTVDVTAEVRAG